jgi:hypothetical protein
MSFGQRHQDETKGSSSYSTCTLNLVCQGINQLSVHYGEDGKHLFGAAMDVVESGARLIQRRSKPLDTSTLSETTDGSRD